MTESPNFEKGLIPAIIQDYYTKKVLMLGYMNKAAYDQTVRSDKVTFFSRSKNRLWTKGETSGHYLNVKSIDLDCDLDTILIQATPEGPTCHTGTDTCFGNMSNTSTDLGFLEATIQHRKQNPKEGSYTNELLANLNKAAQKVGEEAVELVIEAKDNNEELFLNEGADLIYHYIVLLAAKGYKLQDVIEVLKNRHQ